MACRDAEADTDPLQDADRVIGAAAMVKLRERVARKEDDTVQRTVGEINEEDIPPEDVAWNVYSFQLDKGKRDERSTARSACEFNHFV